VLVSRLVLLDRVFVVVNSFKHFSGTSIQSMTVMSTSTISQSSPSELQASTTTFVL